MSGEHRKCPLKMGFTAPLRLSTLKSKLLLVLCYQKQHKIGGIQASPVATVSEVALNQANFQNPQTRAINRAHSNTCKEQAACENSDHPLRMCPTYITPTPSQSSGHTGPDAEGHRNNKGERGCGLLSNLFPLRESGRKTH